jgi:hypothetical protein
VQAAILARSTQLSAQHRDYLAKHPALTELMHDFLTNVLVNKPDDCYQFCQVRRVRAPPPRICAYTRMEARNEQRGAAGVHVHPEERIHTRVYRAHNL